MASKRIWSESTLKWDTAGSELWNVIQKLVRKGNSNGSTYLNYEDEEKQRLQPAIIVSHLIPDNSPEKKQLFERAGISIGSLNRRILNEDILVFITNIKIK